MIRQMIRHIRENAQFDTVGRRCTVWQSGRLIARVRRADGHLMAAARQSAREASQEAWDASVGPRAGGVGRDMKDAKRPCAQ